MSVKVMGSDGIGSTVDVVRGIDYAINHGAKVLNNPWGPCGPGTNSHNRALYDAIDRAQSKDVLFVVAAGNESSDNDEKCSNATACFNHENLISVVATNEDDQLGYLSNYGKKTTHLAAPGIRIFSTIPGNQYKSYDGTSMAAPHVAGAAALIWSRHPNWSFKKVKEVLMNTVDPLPGLTDKTMSGGQLNVLNALEASF